MSAYWGTTGSCCQPIYERTVTHPTHDMNDVRKVDHTSMETSPTLLLFYVPLDLTWKKDEGDKVNA